MTHPGKVVGKRTYQRRFDHEDARQRVAGGEHTLDLAREYGVTENAVIFATDPVAANRNRMTKDLADHALCEKCGEPCLSANHWRRTRTQGRAICHVCEAHERRERFRFDKAGDLAEVKCLSLDCANGERWQPPENFSRGLRNKDVRAGGVHNLCRACGTRMKRRYREARKVPCASCGTPVFHEQRVAKAPECRPCYQKRRLANSPQTR